jgi:hypothetical protein
MVTSTTAGEGEPSGQETESERLVPSTSFPFRHLSFRFYLLLLSATHTVYSRNSISDSSQDQAIVAPQPPLSALQKLSLQNAAKPKLTSSLAALAKNSSSSNTTSTTATNPVAKGKLAALAASHRSAQSPPPQPPKSKLSLLTKASLPPAPTLSSSPTSPSTQASAPKSKLLQKIHAARAPPPPSPTFPPIPIDPLFSPPTPTVEIKGRPSPFASILVSSSSPPSHSPLRMERKDGEREGFAFDTPSPDEIIIAKREGTKLGRTSKS